MCDEREDAVIACSLDAGDLTARIGEIGRLNTSKLRSYRREGRRLELRYEPDTGHLVREMVRKEESCCAFLRFDVRSEPRALVLTIEAPDVTTDALDELFAPFMEGASREF